MPEYIAKSVAIARLTVLEIGNPCATIEDARRTIADTRPADVDTVTRCKDCEKSGVTEFGKRYCKEPMGCFCGCIPVEDDYFCSGGRRKDGAERSTSRATILCHPIRLRTSKRGEAAGMRNMGCSWACPAGKSWACGTEQRMREKPLIRSSHDRSRSGNDRTGRTSCIACG